MECHPHNCSVIKVIRKRRPIAYTYLLKGTTLTGTNQQNTSVWTFTLRCLGTPILTEPPRKLTTCDVYLSDSPVRTRRNMHSLAYKHTSTSSDVFKFSFFPRTIPVWNRLPATVAEAPLFGIL
ncbi:hypothetical protein DPMN_023329 [Dreissena polymorpha]|uniref:Uncharacterized protein n=1 Tax=Dreissena polymorpha TaxID=45954 RepID=A0A9D4RBN4_DREPO|nr:hypothetical protein DPMN_023329 [Dreissena polymorpha]